MVVPKVKVGQNMILECVQRMSKFSCDLDIINVCFILQIHSSAADGCFD